MLVAAVATLQLPGLINIPQRWKLPLPNLFALAVGLGMVWGFATIDLSIDRVIAIAVIGSIVFKGVALFADYLHQEGTNVWFTRQKLSWKAIEYFWNTFGLPRVRTH